MLLDLFMTIADAQIITIILNIADQTIVQAPILSFQLADPKIAKTVNIDVNNSGALVHIAINVAPVISDESFNLLEIFSSDSTKNSSQIIASM